MMYPREYLYRFLRLTQNQSFEPFHWCWPGQNQPLFSIMALIQHLEDCPEDSLAVDTRRLIDLAILMSTSQHNEGIVASDENGERGRRPLREGGTHAWLFIRQAREKVWTKLGMDPQVLNCPNDVRHIRFGEGFEEPIPTSPEKNGNFDAILDQFDGAWPALDEQQFWPLEDLPQEMGY